MKISGAATLHAPSERVWQALNDPAVLVRTIPGCEQLEEIAPDRYRMTISAGVASIKGTYSGEVSLADQQPPSRFVLRASGAGAPGTVSADVQVTLSANGDGTRLDYDADAIVGGPVGGVGQRVLAGVAKKTAGEFFKAVDGILTGEAPISGADHARTAPVGAPAAARVPGGPISGGDHARTTPVGAPAAARMPGGPISGGDHARTTESGAVFRPPTTATAARRGTDGVLLLAAAAVGAAAALLGVALGARVAGRP